VEGTLKSYLPSRRMGFIAGDDGRDYFVHADDAIGQIQWAEGERLSFDETVTPKGYRARQVRAFEPIGAIRYLVPAEVLLTNADAVSDWELIASTPYSIVVQSRISRDAAERSLMQRARSLGANALVNVRYTRSTESEGTDGRGTHHYSVHHLSGDPVVVARRSTNGDFSREDLPDIDSVARAHYRKVTLNNSLHEQRVQPAMAVAAVIWCLIGALAVSKFGFLNFVTFAALGGSGFLLAVAVSSIPPAPLEVWLQPQSAAASWRPA